MDLITLGDVIDAIENLAEADQAKLFKFMQINIGARIVAPPSVGADIVSPPKSSARKQPIVENKPHRKKRPQPKSVKPHRKKHSVKLKSIGAAILHIGPGAMPDEIARDIRVRQGKSGELPNDDYKASRAVVSRIGGSSQIVKCPSGSGYMLKGQQSPTDAPLTTEILESASSLDESGGPRLQ